MNIFIAGQNPASLYASILLRKARPDWQVVVSEQDTRAALPADILTNPVKPQMRLRDVDVAAAIAAITVDIHRVDVSRSSSAGHDIRQIEGLAYRTISASELHNALRQEALRAGCVFASAAPENPDLVLVGDCNKLGGLGADAASLLMPLPAGSRAHVQFRVNANAGALAFGFHDTGRGVISAVLIPDSACSSSLILEGTPEAITATGPDVHAFCKTAFADLIGGAEFEMLSREPRPVQLAGKWHAGHIALIGAAASQPHYSIGLAARSGFEDAEALVDALLDHSSVPEALAAWQALRFPKAESLHRAADSSANWLAHVHQVYDMPMSRFAFACITRSLRLTYTHVKHAAPAFTREVDAIVAGPATGSANVPPPPMFTPYSMRGLTIPNRMSFSPMCL